MDFFTRLCSRQDAECGVRQKMKICCKKVLKLTEILLPFPGK